MWYWVSWSRSTLPETKGFFFKIISLFCRPVMLDRSLIGLTELSDRCDWLLPSNPLRLEERRLSRLLEFSYYYQLQPSGKGCSIMLRMSVYRFFSWFLKRTTLNEAFVDCRRLSCRKFSFSIALSLDYRFLADSTDRWDNWEMEFLLRSIIDWARSAPYVLLLAPGLVAKLANIAVQHSWLQNHTYDWPWSYSTHDCLTG